MQKESFLESLGSIKNPEHTRTQHRKMLCYVESEGENSLDDFDEYRNLHLHVSGGELRI